MSTHAARNTTASGRWMAAVLLVAAGSLAGCQQAVDVGAVNRCGRPVEAHVSSQPDSAQPDFLLIAEGDRRYLGSLPDATRRLYVNVRVPGGTEPARSEVDVAGLRRAAPGDYEEGVEREIVLTGDLCPRSGQGDS